jgi:uncharacterized Zn finger protein
MAKFWSTCPKCSKEAKHKVVERIDGIWHIPPRVVLRCASCGDIFYRRDTLCQHNLKKT